MLLLAFAETMTATVLTAMVASVALGVEKIDLIVKDRSSLITSMFMIFRCLIKFKLIHVVVLPKSVYDKVLVMDGIALSTRYSCNGGPPFR